MMRPEKSVAEDLGVRDHGRERRAQVVRDVGEELRLELIPRPQVRDLFQRLAQLRLERLNALVARRGGSGGERGAFRVDPGHGAPLPSAIG